MPPKPKDAKAKPSTKSVRTLKKAIVLPIESITDLLTEALSATNDPPSKVKIKRKAEDSSAQSDDDVQIISKPLASPKKRCTVQAPPASSSSAPNPDLSPETSLVEALDAAFVANMAGSLSPTVTRPVRSKVKTEKARLSEEAAAEAKSTPRKSLQRVNTEAAAAREKWEQRNESSSPTPKASRKLPVESIRSSAADVSDDELPEVSEIMKSPTRPRRKNARPRMPDSDAEGDADAMESEPQMSSTPPPESDDNPFIDDEAMEGHESEEDGAPEEVPQENHEEEGEEEEENGVADGADDGDEDHEEGNGSDGKGKAKPIVDENDVMQPDLWHESMKKTYLDLPRLEKFCDVRPFSLGSNLQTDVGSLRVKVDMLAMATKKPDLPALVAGLTFVRSGVYVNTARVDPKVLTVESNRLKIAGTKTTAIGVMVGMVTECALISVAETTSRNPQNVHRITIAPAPQEMRRDTSMWGLVLNFQLISGLASEIGFSFSTYPEGKAPVFGGVSSPSTPKRSSKYAMTVKSPLISKAMSSAQLGQALSFEQRVPIYDGRITVNGQPGKPFLFSDDHFDNLSSWPLYEGGDCDVPLDAVVAIGYSLGTYASPTSGAKYLSSNIQFVIVLAIPEAEIG